MSKTAVPLSDDELRAITDRCREHWKSAVGREPAHMTNTIVAWSLVSRIWGAELEVPIPKRRRPPRQFAHPVVGQVPPLSALREDS